MLVLGTEALGNKPLETLQRCFDFLEVDPLPADVVAELAGRRFNEARLPRSWALQQWIGKRRGRMPLVAGIVDKLNLRPATNPPMPDEARAYLVEQLADDTARLEREFDFDTSVWSSRWSGGERAVASATQPSPGGNDDHVGATAF